MDSTKRGKPSRQAASKPGRAKKGRSKMISKINMRSDEMVSGGPKEWPTEFVADWELVKFHCQHCGLAYGHKVQIKEFRPVIDGADDFLDTLHILPGGDTSPAGAFGFRELCSIPNPCHSFHNHYYLKSRADLLVFVDSESTIKLFPTRRYLNPSLWGVAQTYSDSGRWTGSLGYEENDFSLVYWAEKVKFVDLPEYQTVETTHKKCREAIEAQKIEARTSRIKIGCTTIEVVRPDGEWGSPGKVRCGCWELNILRSDNFWEGTKEDFDRHGECPPFSRENIEGRYEEILDAFNALGVHFYLEEAGWFLPDGTDVSEMETVPKGAMWKSTGRVAFQWKEVTNE